MSDCPWGDCPAAPHPCQCWDPAPYGATAENHTPCEGCWIWSGRYQVCDGSCAGHSERQWRKRYYGHRWDGRPLIHNGRKP